MARKASPSVSAWKMYALAPVRQASKARLYALSRNCRNSLSAMLSFSIFLPLLPS